MDKVTEYTGATWSVAAVEKLQQLWREGVPAELIAVTLKRTEADVRAKAAEFKLPQHVADRNAAA